MPLIADFLDIEVDDYFSNYVRLANLNPIDKEQFGVIKYFNSHDLDRGLLEGGPGKSIMAKNVVINGKL
jgi:hypothetical protein